MALTIRQLLGTKRTKACASLPQTQQVVLCGIVQFCATEPDLMEQTLEKLHAFYQTFCKVLSCCTARLCCFVELSRVCVSTQLLSGCVSMSVRSS